MLRTELSCLAETLVALAALTALNALVFPDYPAFLAVNPHPFFALVILMSLRYGRVASLLSTAVSCATLWLLVAWGPSAQVPGVWDEVTARVGLLAITNLVLGQLGATFTREVQEARRDLTQLREEHEALKTKYHALSAVKDELSERIVGQASSLVSLYEASKSLESLDLKEIQATLLQLAQKFVGAESCSVFWADERDGLLRPLQHLGWTDEERRLRGSLALKPGEGAVGLAAQEGRMLTVQDLQGRGDLPGASGRHDVPTVMAVPLIVGGRATGVLNVERMPFLKFTPTAARLLYLIADLGASAIAKSARFSAMQDLPVVDHDTGLHTERYFEARFKDELQRFARARTTFTYALMRVDGWERLEGVLKDKVRRFAREVAGLVFATKRDLDVVSPGALPGTWRILLPLTDAEGAVTFARKVQREVLGRISVTTRSGALRPTASFGLATAAEGLDTREGLEAAADRALRAAGQTGQNAVHVGAGGVA